MQANLHAYVICCLCTCHDFDKNYPLKVDLLEEYVYLTIVYIFALPTCLEILIFPSLSSPHMYLETVFLCIPVLLATSSMDRSLGYSFRKHSIIFCSGDSDTLFTNNVY